MPDIRFIDPAHTRNLRSVVLRPGRPVEECIYPEDTAPGAFHLASFDGEKITGIASFSGENIEGATNAYRLRGMAVDPARQGQGIGADIMAFAFAHLASLGCDVLWCNARSSAAGFYTNLGFGIFSDEFDIPGIGPHYKMKRSLSR